LLEGEFGVGSTHLDSLHIGSVLGGGEGGEGDLELEVVWGRGQAEQSAEQPGVEWRCCATKTLSEHFLRHFANRSDISEQKETV